MIKGISKKYLLTLIHEARYRLILMLCVYLITCIFSYINKDKIYKIITLSTKNIKFIYINIWDAFVSDLSVCMYFSFLICLPYISYHVYRFISPALKQNEKRSFLYGISIGNILSILSILFLFLYIMPAMSKSLLYSTAFYSPMISIKSYISTLIMFSIIFIIIFQFPIAIILLEKTNIVSVKKLCSMRKYNIIIFLSIAAIVTPPDILSQLIVAGIFAVMYELSILYIKYSNKWKQKVNS